LEKLVSRPDAALTVEKKHNALAVIKVFSGYEV
jgi:hypothetical protein